ncbi:hypothetical protein MAR_006197, partial [Mya arenaria]
VRRYFSTVLLSSYHHIFSCACGGYCYTYYSKTYSCTVEVIRSTDCGLFGWNRCQRVSYQTQTCYRAAHNQICCDGYMNPDCSIPARVVKIKYVEVLDTVSHYAQGEHTAHIMVPVSTLTIAPVVKVTRILRLILKVGM